MAKQKVTQNRDVHQHVTNHIIAAIEAGAGDWRMPWHRSSTSYGAQSRPVNVASGKAYQGINTVCLWATAMANGYASQTWGTYKQWQDQGAQVRRGEKASPVVFYKQFEARDPDDDEKTRTMRVARLYWAFAAEQVDGAHIQEPEPMPAFQRNERAERFMTGTGATIRHGGDRAYYSPAGDYVQLPDRERFTGTDTSTPEEAYYSTGLHELTHWTGAPGRLDRDKAKQFGDGAYAFEELVAELGAAFLCADLEISNEPRADHAQYLAHWLEILKADKRAIFKASALAQKAATYLHEITAAPAMPKAA